MVLPTALPNSARRRSAGLMAAVSEAALLPAGLLPAVGASCVALMVLFVS
jgi:hypothetical protein